MVSGEHDMRGDAHHDDDAPTAAMLDHALAVARAAATEAADAIRAAFASGVAVRQKADRTPVTDADEEAERIIRAHLRQAFPTHAIFGEEGGREGAADSDWLWLVDPIDGTKSFVRGYGMFSTQIALMHRGELVLGVSSAPVAHEACHARRGGGAFLVRAGQPPRPLRCAATATLERAAISFGNLKTLAAGRGWQAMAALVASADRTRGYGDYYHYHLLAQGSLDLVLESDVNILDIAALAVIVREAGGVFTDLDGAAPTLATRSVLAATPALHATVLPMLEGWR